jgi:cobalt-zinc-cadmium resistance protein CzcA
VIVGGMLLSPICSLLVIPTFARLFMPGPRKAESAEPAAAAEATADPA